MNLYFDNSDSLARLTSMDRSLWLIMCLLTEGDLCTHRGFTMPSVPRVRKASPGARFLTPFRGLNALNPGGVSLQYSRGWRSYGARGSRGFAEHGVHEAAHSSPLAHPFPPERLPNTSISTQISPPPGSSIFVEHCPSRFPLPSLPG